MKNNSGPVTELHLARVINNTDPDNRGRLEVQMQTSQMTFWAPCLSNSAGNGYGLSVLPKIDEVVLVAFVEPDLPIVLGALWTGSNSQPVPSNSVEESYALTSPAGSHITLDDGDGGSIRTETSSGYHITIDEKHGGEIVIEKGAESIRISDSGININTTAKVQVNAATVEINASMLNVNAATAKFSGTVQCETMISNSVVSASYTPGAGNIW